MQSSLTTLWVALLVVGSAGAAGLPDPSPVFEPAQIGTEVPQFSVPMIDLPSRTDNVRRMIAQPALSLGNKAVVIRWPDVTHRPADDHAVSIVVDRTAVARIVFWGDDGKGNFGYPFKDREDDKPTLTHDEATQTITYRKPYVTPAGKQSIFSYTLRPDSAGRVSLLWTLGLTQSEMAAEPAGFGVSVWISMPEYRTTTVEVGHDRVAASPRERFLNGKPISRHAAGPIRYAADAPLKGFSIFGEQLAGDVRETLQAAPGKPDEYLLEYRLKTRSGQTTGEVTIDLGQAALSDDRQRPPVGGIDFWKTDATHVPTSPIRNLMPNASFEQGLRYWTWMDGGATYAPSQTPRYSVAERGLFGPHALLINNVQAASSAMMSFPIPLDAGETYTLSFHAQAEPESRLTVTLASAARSGRFQSPRGPWGDVENPDAAFTIGKSWKRYFRTFTADAAGIRVGIMATNTTLIDGIQLEKGRTPTDFVAVPIDGLLVTADEDNSLTFGQPMSAALRCTGNPAERGFVIITARNVYGEPVYRGRGPVTIGASGVSAVPLPFSAERFGEGVFVVRVEYDVAGTVPYVDYHRLAIIRPLENRHPLKDLCGTIGAYDRISRGDDLARRLMQWGFGSTSWGCDPAPVGERPALEAKYRIRNVGNVLQNKDPVAKDYLQWREVSPELERRIETAAFEHAKRHDPRRDTVWAFGNEEEGSYLVRNGLFNDHLRVQMATARGVRRAIPDAISLPTFGTSGYSSLRGFEAMEGYLSVAKANGWKYGGIAIHPYGNIDRGSLSMHDLDEETTRLLAQMKRFGYGPDTPIFFTEMFNIPETFIPQWNADRSFDEYSAGKPTYDFGNREFVQAASAARAVIIMAKYWPQLRSANFWIARPFMDMHLTPLVLCKAFNTIGHTLQDVRHVADVKPSARIRGYVFKRSDGTGVAAIWCIDRDVENGLRRGPRIRVHFSQNVAFSDFMGCSREQPVSQDGKTFIPLTPAPLYITASDARILANDLMQLTHDDTSLPLEVTVVPQTGGGLACKLKNRTGAHQAGRLVIEPQSTAYALAPGIEQFVDIIGHSGDSRPGRLNSWAQNVRLEPQSGPATELHLETSYLFVPQRKQDHDWAGVPAVTLTRRFGPVDDNFSAAMRVAWDDDSLRVRIDVADPAFRKLVQNSQEQAGTAIRNRKQRNVELYLDTAANGRAHVTGTLDADDYRYDFSPPQSATPGKATVHRKQAVYHQLADGTNMPTNSDVAAHLPCEFENTAEGYRFTISLGQKFVLPIRLRRAERFGLGLIVHAGDYLATGEPEEQGVALGIEADKGSMRTPATWPIAVLEQ
jgi:hypothetical protein